MLPSRVGGTHGQPDDSGSLVNSRNDAPSDVGKSTVPPASPPKSLDPEQRIPAPSKTQDSTPHSMDAYWFSNFEQRCSQRVKRVLIHSRKDSTRATYLAKWSRFQAWCAVNNLDPHSTSLPRILEYILQLHDNGLAIASLRVHLAAINAFHHMDDSFSIFAHPTTKRFLKGLANLNAPSRPPPPAWNLDLVLEALSHPPFERLATIPLHILTIKLLFLLALTSARRVSEIKTMNAASPYTIFSKDSHVESSPSVYSKGVI